MFIFTPAFLMDLCNEHSVFSSLEKVEPFPGLRHLLADPGAVLTLGLGVQPKTLELKEFLCISGADVRDPVFTLCPSCEAHDVSFHCSFNWGTNSTSVVLPRPVLVT